MVPSLCAPGGSCSPTMLRLEYTAVILQVVFPVWCNLQFPADFKFGAGTSAYQVEGAWNVSDKSASIWDTFTHNRPEKISGRATGDVACDSYHLWRRDVEMAAELRLDFYRFSISWPRLLPTGFNNKVSKDGVQYYNNLINGLLEAGIEPMVTLYHFDLPQSLQDFGGWTNPLVSEWFADYARVVFSHFGDRVKTWLTVNEPMSFCDIPFNMDVYAPGILSPDIGTYLCAKNVLIAHAKAYRIYEEEFKAKYHGKVSLAIQLMWFEPYSSADEETTELARQLLAGLYSHPVYSKEGGWPPSIEKTIAENSRKEGYSRSRLPPFTENEIKLVRGTSDFYALNYYTARAVQRAGSGEAVGPWFMAGSREIRARLLPREHWRRGAEHWLYLYPKGLRYQLNWLKKEYGDMEFIITENGYPSDGLEFHDHDRIQYYKEHLEQVLLAIHQDGVNVSGYTAWTLMDNFEWSSGYGISFGLYAVEFSSPARTRTPRSSAHYYAAVSRSHSPHAPHAHSALARKPHRSKSHRPHHGGISLTVVTILHLMFYTI